MSRRWLRALASATAMPLAACSLLHGPGPARNGRTQGAPRHTGWSRPAWSTPMTGWPFALTVAGDDAVVVAGRGAVVDLDPSGGRERWHATVPGAAHYEPAPGAGTVVVSAGNRLVALDLGSGRQRWEHQVEGPAGAAVVAPEQSLALATTEDGAVVALDVHTGEPRWSQRFPGALHAAPAVEAGSGAAAIAWNGDQPRLRVLDLATGAVRWEAAMGVSSSAPAVRDGMVFTGEGDGRYHARIVARDLASGAERWSVDAPASFEPSLTPGVADRAVAVADHFGTVTLVDDRTGRVRWRRSLGEPLLRTPVLVDRAAVALSTARGHVVLVDRHTGRVVVRRDPGGFPVGLALGAHRLLVALRLTSPGRVEAHRLG